MIGNKFYTIAEIASAHNGEVQEVFNILNRFSRTGFDYFKFQVFKLEELVNVFEDKNSALKNIEISDSSWQMIFREIEENFEEYRHIKFIAEPYDLISLELCKKFEIFDAYKVPTSDLSNISFIENFLNITDNLYLGTGGSEINEISETINFIKNSRPDIKIKLIHGFQSYPTNVEDMDLWKISFLKNKFDLEVGFADHSDASSEVLRYLPATLALTFGADFIEKHITIDRDQKKPDYYSSLNPGEINNFLFSLNTANNLLLRGKNYLLSDSENKYRKSMKKFAIAKKDFAKGEIISSKYIVFKRSLKGNISISDMNQIIDKVVLNPISKGSPILRENIL